MGRFSRCFWREPETNDRRVPIDSVAVQPPYLLILCVHICDLARMCLSSQTRRPCASRVTRGHAQDPPSTSAAETDPGRRPLSPPAPCEHLSFPRCVQGHVVLHFCAFCRWFHLEMEPRVRGCVWCSKHTKAVRPVLTVTVTTSRPAIARLEGTDKVLMVGPQAVPLLCWRLRTPFTPDLPIRERGLQPTFTTSP